MLLCPPDYYNISYEINPWMNVSHGASQTLAIKQWQGLQQSLIDCGAKVQLMPPSAGLPDLVFTANCGILQGSLIYLSRFRYPQRQGERELYKKWFIQEGYQIAEELPQFFDHEQVYVGPHFEGAGDALFLGDTLFAGYGFRTDKEIYPHLFELFNLRKHVFCELVDPHFYHLDTCFCPLNDHQALWFPPAFSAETRQRMKKAADLFAIPAEEERHFACNSVIIDQNAIIPEKCPFTGRILENLGFNVRECAMTEFIKSGGACKCLIFKLSARQW